MDRSYGRCRPEHGRLRLCLLRARIATTPPSLCLIPESLSLSRRRVQRPEIRELLQGRIAFDGTKRLARLVFLPRTQLRNPQQQLRIRRIRHTRLCKSALNGGRCLVVLLEAKVCDTDAHIFVARLRGCSIRIRLGERRLPGSSLLLCGLEQAVVAVDVTL